MKITFTGKNINVDDLVNKLTEVIVTTSERLEKESKGKTVIESTGIVEADFTIKFKVEGMDEPQVLTVEHHKGQPEMYQWIVNMDEDTIANNELDSMFDDYTVAKAKGEELKFKEIESIYNDADLTEESSEVYSDMAKIIFNHKDGFKVVRIYQDDKLIQEFKLIPKEDKE